MKKGRKVKQGRDLQLNEIWTVTPFNQESEHRHHESVALAEDPLSSPLSSPQPTDRSFIPIAQFIRQTSQKSSNPRDRRPLKRPTSSDRPPTIENCQSSDESEMGTSGVGDSSSVGGSPIACEELGSSDKIEPEPEPEPKFSSSKEDNYSSTLEGIVNRLKELSIGFEEPQLSEDQLRINDQEQEDELLALEAIYGEDVSFIDSHGELHALQIHIHIEASDDFSISAKLHSTSGGFHLGESSSTNDANFLYQFKVQHLPPIVLTCLLPRSYPSHLPPHFTLYVPWWNSSRISDLCGMLDKIWVEQPGQVVIYQWAEWLHRSSFTHLGINKEVTLGPYHTSNAGDGRAHSGCTSPEVDIPLLMSYNDYKRREEFCKSLHTCTICLNDCIGTEFIKLPCQHFFCCKCMGTYSNMHVNEGTVNKLLCPDPKCGGLVPPGLLKLILGEEAFERWESLLLQKTLDSMADIVYCPRCETACLEDEENHAQCAKCFFSFCTLCRERRHVGVTCMSPEDKLRILQERQNLSHLKPNQRHKELELINDILSVTKILTDAKQCPSCKMAISRVEGCNKMVCQNCGQLFCYACNTAIDGYGHFSEGTCTLFPEQEIQNWELQMNHDQVNEQGGDVPLPHRDRPCPNCGQVNAKVGSNNHIFCWSCQIHYCGLCRKVVRRLSQHYGRKGCRQHS
ncbi:hypothetical protein AMTRI_Chr03g51730 [Amborella trichopoda]